MVQRDIIKKMKIKHVMILLIILVLAIQSVSAGFFEDLFNKITGRVTENTTTEPEPNITEPDTIPNEEQLAGIAPDSAFYGLDVFVDNARATLTPTSLGKAKVRLEIMGERMAEMMVMADKNKTTEAKRAGLEGQKQIKKFESSIEKVKKKDAPELKEYMQKYNARLKEWKQRLRNYNLPDYADAIAEAIVLLETTENIIVNIPEDLGPESTFIISSICKEMGATTVDECNEMISSGALTASFRKVSREEMLADPHGCFSGSYSSFIKQTKWCCDDSDGTYSPEYVENILSGFGEHISSIPRASHSLDYYHRKGTVNYKIINLKSGAVEEGIETDSCDGNTLTEWFCPRVMDQVTRNERYSEEYDCPYRCEYGACIREIIEEEVLEKVPEIEGVEWECIDSDGGQDYFVKGTVNTSYTSELTTYFYYRTDYCVDGVQLREAFCGTNNQFTISVHSCPNSCQDGACI